MYKSVEELISLRQRVELGAPIDNAEIVALIDQAIRDQRSVNRLLGFLGLMLRSGSSWGKKIEKVIKEVLFDDAPDAAAAATIALLERYRNLSVRELLSKLDTYRVS